MEGGYLIVINDDDEQVRKSIITALYITQKIISQYRPHCTPSCRQAYHTGLDWLTLQMRASTGGRQAMT